MKLFVVSLERAKDRRARIREHLDHLNINYELYNAVDGHKLTPSEMEGYCDMSVINQHPKWLTKGMIGACLSHYSIYKKIVEENIPFACIIEDDAVVSSSLIPILDFIEQNVAKDSLTLLHYTSWEKIRLSRKEVLNIEEYALYEPETVKGMNSAAGYVVTREICEQLIEKLFPIHMGPDSWYEMLVEKGFSRIQCVYPNPVNITYSKSTIDYIKAKSLFSKTTLLIDHYRIFPAYQILKYRRKYNNDKMRRITIVK